MCFSGQHEWQGIYIKRPDPIYVPLSGEEMKRMNLRSTSCERVKASTLVCWFMFLQKAIGKPMFRLGWHVVIGAELWSRDRSVTSEHLPTHATNDSHATSNTRLPLFQPSTPSDMLQPPHFTSGEGSGCSHTTRSQSAGQQNGKCQGQNFYLLNPNVRKVAGTPSCNNTLHAHSHIVVFFADPP